jgi:hypothetical protein
METVEAPGVRDDRQVHHPRDALNTVAGASARHGGVRVETRSAPGEPMACMTARRAMARGPRRVGRRPRPLGVPRGTLLNIFAPRAEGALAPVHTWTTGCGRPAMSHGCRACCRLWTWVAGSWTLTGEVQVRAEGHLAQSESSGPVAPAGGAPGGCGWAGEIACSGRDRPAHQSISTGSVKVDGGRAPGAGRRRTCRATGADRDRRAGPADQADPLTGHA